MVDKVAERERLGKHGKNLGRDPGPRFSLSAFVCQDCGAEDTDAWEYLEECSGGPVCAKCGTPSPGGPSACRECGSGRVLETQILTAVLGTNVHTAE